MSGNEAGRVALVLRGDRAQRDAATFENSRLAPVAQALAEVGLAPEPAVFFEDMADEVRDQLLSVQGVPVWVDPVAGGDDSRRLEAILREMVAAGVWVSDHPDVI